jgi:xanthine dehydrogenase YagR molybdenum-binding subunit
MAVGEIEEFRRRRLVVGVGYRGPNPEGKATCPFAAQFCEVEVDKRTGEVKVLRFLGAHDSGRVMSRLTFDTQVYGGIVMGIGFGLTECRVLDREQTGKMVNLAWHDYKIPTSLDVPADITSLPIETEDRECNTVGAKGLGEPVTIPTAAAIANAVYNATRVRVTETPISPPRLVELLAARDQRET